MLDAVEIAVPGDRARADQLLAVREAVPAAVNRRVGLAKQTIDPRIEKTAADMIVPFDAFDELLTRYDEGFARRGLDAAVWGHVSDGNVHPNIIPRSYDDVESGKAAILEFGREVIRLGGSPLAEHGVGRNAVKQQLLIELYGQDGVEEMRRVKRAIDPGVEARARRDVYAINTAAAMTARPATRSHGASAPASPASTTSRRADASSMRSSACATAVCAKKDEASAASSSAQPTPTVMRAPPPARRAEKKSVPSHAATATPATSRSRPISRSPA